MLTNTTLTGYTPPWTRPRPNEEDYTDTAWLHDCPDCGNVLPYCECDD